MKKSNQIILQLNELLVINYNVEKIYLDVLNKVESENLKHFFRAMAFERSEFCRFLGAEIIQKGGKPDYSESSSQNTTDLWANNLIYILSTKDEYAIIGAVCTIKSWSIEKYNAIIDKIMFTDNVVHLLIKQRSAITKGLSTIKANNTLISA